MNWAWGQFGLLAFAAACVFVSGARQKHITINKSVLLEIAQAVAIVVLLFALITEGRGCVGAGTAYSDPCLESSDRC
jgi:hypothetical protein